MSDSDLPDLVESSEDDSGENEQSQKGLVYADTWLKKGDKYLEKQELWMRVFSLAPFLFGVNNIISAAWNKALVNAKLLLKEKTDYQTTYLEWQEWECLDLVDHVVSEVQLYLRDRNHLAKTLDCAEKLDDCKDGVIIDVDLAINKAHKVNAISDLWRRILKQQDLVSSGREKAAKFAVLYVMRIYREHVIFLCDKTQDFIEHIKKRHMKPNNLGQKKAEEYKKKGNEYFKSEDFENAVKYYSSAAREDPFSHVYYGNRAQAYLSLKKYRDALADGRRAIIIKPDFPKGHYRYAVAFHGLGQLDSAVRVNEKGLELCRKSSTQDLQNIKELETQGLNFYQERSERNRSNLLTSIPKGLDDKLAAIPNPNTDITEKLGCTLPVKTRKTGNETSCRGSSESDSEVDTTHDHKKVRRKKKSKPKTTAPKDISSKAEKEEEMVILQEKHNESSDQINKKIEKQVQKQEFLMFLTDGSDSFMRQANKKAMTSFQKAMEMVTLNGNQKEFGMDDSDMLALKYAFSISAIGTNNYKNIMDGIEKLEEIKDFCETHDDIKFPVLYYGLGKAYVSLNRFPEALEPLQDGYQIASSVTYPQITWPGTKQLIKETDPLFLQESLKGLLQLCRFPPPPDAVCRNHTDTTDKRTVIYLTDPGFKGYIKIICQMDCVITFHQVCFKSYKNTLNKQSDKDVLDTLCPTPDCVGYIIKVHVVRSDSLSKEYQSEKYADLKEKNKKPVAKQKTTNESKIAKKQDKKDKRKQKRKEYIGHDMLTNNKQKTEESGEVITDGASAMAFIADIESEVQALPDVKDTTVLKKDSTADVQKPGKSRKNKKKTKDKSKQILNVEVNFSDRKEETLLNENSVLSDEEKENINGQESIQNPFSVPAELKSQIKNFEKTYTGPPKTALLSKPDEVTENLFLYFVEILKANGPLAIDDTRVQQELEVFPPEALEKIKLVGGLADFLRQSLKFAVIDDVISLMSDAKRAREIALIRRQERQTTGTEPVVQNVWKTVGKSVNNVDALSESVKTNITSVAPISTSSSLNFSDVNSSTSSNTSSVLPNTNNSNSVSPFGNFMTSTSSESKPTMHWSEGVSSFDIKTPFKPPAPLPVPASTMNTLDSIDDLPYEDTCTSEPKVNKDLDDIDDLDRLSESESEHKESQESGSFKSGLRLDPRLAALDTGKVDSSSRCSSKSDISDRSYGSAFGSIGQQKTSQIWDKLESDFDSAWSRVSKEEYSVGDKNSAEVVSLEVKRLGEEFVRKSDETFVSELAESVVAKLYEGKLVTDNERSSTLNKVSADIWKDFERSANAGKKGGSSLWANTPAGADYSKNMRKFANDFMKRHYNSERNLVSPTSDLSTLQSQNTSVSSESFSSLSNNPGFNSSLPWPEGKSNTSYQGQPAVSSNSGYNLFSGPTWGLDSFNSSSNTSGTSPLAVPPPKTLPPPIPVHFVRPPLAVSGYYQSPSMQVPFRPPPRLPMPPPMGMPFPPQIRFEKKDKETQSSLQVNSIGTMTDVYEPFKNEYLQMKENRDEAIRVMAESKNLYEKLLLEHKAKEQQIMVLEADINNKVGMFDLEKKSWKNERDAFGEEIKRLQEQVASRDSQEKELKEKMVGQERRVNELAILAKDQRDKDLTEIKKCMDNAEKFRHLYDKQLQRAISAETEILISRSKTAKNILERSQKEASFHQQRLSSFAQKHEEDKKPVPPSLQQALDFLTSAAKKSEEDLKNVTAQYEDQIARVKKGTPLDELEQITLPSPPTVPESIRGLPFMQPGMPGFMMPRMQFPTRPPFNNTGMQKLPSPVGAAPAAIGAPVSAGPAKPTETAPQMAQIKVTSSAEHSSIYNPVQVSSRQLVSASTAAGSPRPGQIAPRAPLAVPNRAPLRPIGIAGLTATMSSFDKLVLKLKMTFPEKSRSDITQLIHGLRQKRGGSLSGMTMEDIIQQVSELITSQQEHSANTGTPEQTSTQQVTAGAKAIGPPPGLSTSWAFKAAAGTKEGSGKGSSSELYREDEEDPCVICHEEMDPKSIVTLECGHLFHDECIRKWFQEQSTCPNCRVHTLLSDEFPSLG